MPEEPSPDDKDVYFIKASDLWQLLQCWPCQLCIADGCMSSCSLLLDHEQLMNLVFAQQSSCELLLAASGQKAGTCSRRAVVACKHALPWQVSPGPVHPVTPEMLLHKVLISCAACSCVLQMGAPSSDRICQAAISRPYMLCAGQSFPRLRHAPFRSPTPIPVRFGACLPAAVRVLA